MVSYELIFDKFHTETETKIFSGMIAITIHAKVKNRLV